jgi:ABC-2 type transport system permease protein
MATILVFDRRPRWVQAISESLIMAQRSSRHIVRNHDQTFAIIGQPVMFFVLFATIFGGTVGKSLQGGASYLSFLVPGIIIQTLVFGSASTAVAINHDFSRGILDRFRSLPMNSLSVLNGHVLSDVMRNGISTIVLLVVGFLMGYRPSVSLSGLLLLIGLFMTFSISLSWLSAIIGILAKSAESVQMLLFMIIFPITYISSAFVPVDSMPRYLRAFSENQPISEAVNTARAALLGQPVGDHGWLTLAWGISVLAVALPLSSYLFRRKTVQ